jgi:hypothetical protein
VKNALAVSLFFVGFFSVAYANHYLVEPYVDAALNGFGTVVMIAFGLSVLAIIWGALT